MGNASTEQKDDFEIIRPPDALKSKVRKLTGREAEKDPVAEAENAVKALATRFSIWMSSEVDQLMRTWTDFSDGTRDDESYQSLFRAVHDIKGQAATLGYPLAGNVAGSLTHLFEHVPDADRLPMELLGQHVNAIRAIVSENARDADNPTGSELAKRLTEVTQEYVEAVAKAA